jgi:hypothetical protein
VKNKRMNRMAHISLPAPGRHHPKTWPPKHHPIHAQLLQPNEEGIEDAEGEEVGNMALEGADLEIGEVECRVRDSSLEGREILDRRGGVGEGMA